MNTNFFALLIPLALLSACGGGEGDDDNHNPSSQNNSVLTTPSEGRILASQCAQCHGTDGISVSGIESLAGESGEIRGEMLGMLSNNRNRIMHLQAKGYTRDEIITIANYFNDLYQGGGNNENNQNEQDNDENNNDDENDD